MSDLAFTVTHASDAEQPDVTRMTLIHLIVSFLRSVRVFG
jgi:hypothetical protein